MLPFERFDVQIGDNIHLASSIAPINTSSKFQKRNELCVHRNYIENGINHIINVRRARVNRSNERRNSPVMGQCIWAGREIDGLKSSNSTFLNGSRDATGPHYATDPPFIFKIKQKIKHAIFIVIDRCRGVVGVASRFRIGCGDVMGQHRFGHLLSEACFTMFLFGFAWS